MMVPRGMMLGGSSGMNYMAYVRAHPGDFDSWAAQGATGWSYDEVLPHFMKSEDPPRRDTVAGHAGSDQHLGRRWLRSSGLDRPRLAARLARRQPADHAL